MASTMETIDIRSSENFPEATPEKSAAASVIDIIPTSTPHKTDAWWTRTTKSSRRTHSRIARWFQKLGLVIWFESKFPGWQAGVAIGIAVAVFVFIFNCVFLFMAVRRHWGGDGLGTLVEGDCEVINKWNKIAHGFINILSTCLLMQSNYCMQLLASPTRHEVDMAHRRRVWVDIGIQSFRNVWKRHISPWRCLYWIILAFSSMPLHLLWNSVVIFSPSAFQYYQIAVTEGFVWGQHPHYSQYTWLADPASPSQPELWPDNPYILQSEIQQKTSQWKNLSTLDCKRAYAQAFVRDRSDVIVVTPSKPQNNESSILRTASAGWGAWPYKWMCPSDSAETFKCYDEIRQPGEVWNLPNIDNTPKVLYCMSKEQTATCKLQYGFWIALYVVIANLFKVVCFIITFRIMKAHTKSPENGPENHTKHGDRLLITTGDAVASFLEYPDNETRGMSIVEKKDFRNGIWDLRWISIEPMLWRPRYECSWFRAIGLQRWMISIVLLLALALVPFIFLLSKLSWFTNDIGLTQASLLQLGIGNPSGLFLFGTRTSNTDQYQSGRLLGKVALANSPQLLVSIAYYLWNNHLTAMIAAREYDTYAAPIRNAMGVIYPANKRGLRLTNPHKETAQKSTRFVTVPLKYWVANVILWTLLHYLASQAVFFARVDVLDHWLEVTQWSISQVGYSVLGLIYFLVCAAVVFLYATWTSLRRLRNRMPLAATCSGALSAACHPRDSGQRHHEKKVHWGVEIVTRGDENADGGGGGGIIDDSRDEKYDLRCTFTSGAAYYPEVGRFYA